MKKWTYTGDASVENGGTWLLNQHLLKGDEFVSVVQTYEVNGDNIFGIESGTLYIPHQNHKMRADALATCGWYEDESGQLREQGSGEALCEDRNYHLLLLAEASMARHGMEVDRRVVVMIGKDERNQLDKNNCIHGYEVTDFVRANTRLRNFIQRNFLVN